jgi:hypothetical protein
MEYIVVNSGVTKLYLGFLKSNTEPLNLKILNTDKHPYVHFTDLEKLSLVKFAYVGLILSSSHFFLLHVYCLKKMLLINDF